MGDSLWSRVQTLIGEQSSHLPVQLRDRVHVLSTGSTDRVEAEREELARIERAERAVDPQIRVVHLPMLLLTATRRDGAV